MRVLVLNCGSSSVKYQMVDLNAAGGAPSREERRPRGCVEWKDATAAGTFVDPDGAVRRETLALHEPADAVRLVCTRLGAPTGKSALAADAVGHRVVHGGERFTATTRVDAAMLTALDALSVLAPLHNPACVNGIRAAQDTWGADFPMAAVFDTAFHSTLPPYAATYAIPTELAQRHHIRRYGFHGIAHAAVAARFGEISGLPRERARLVTLHLGGGCSVAAIRGGRSVDTSMGFTPLAGLMMGTRCGDVDPSIVGYLAGREGVPVETVDAWLNESSGLLGVSGRSADMRVLTASMDRDARARLAVEMFCYGASKYVGAYLTVLGGADAVIFSGGIGEHSPPVRARVCAALAWCGVALDARRNEALVGTEGPISSGGSLPAYVVPADEELLIARETARCLGGAA